MSNLIITSRELLIPDKCYIKKIAIRVDGKSPDIMFSC